MVEHTKWDFVDGTMPNSNPRERTGGSLSLFMYLLAAAHVAFHLSLCKNKEVKMRETR